MIDGKLDAREWLKATDDFKRRVLEQRQKEVSKFMRTQAVRQVSWTKDRMDRGISPRGKTWPAYSERYKEYRLSKGRPGRPDLQFTGEMKASIGFKQESAERVVIGAGIGKSLELHTDLSRRHQTGQGVPKREHIGFSARDEKRHTQAFRDFMDKQIKRSFGSG